MKKLVLHGGFKSVHQPVFQLATQTMCTKGTQHDADGTTCCGKKESSFQHDGRCHGKLRETEFQFL